MWTDLVSKVTSEQEALVIKKLKDLVIINADKDAVKKMVNRRFPLLERVVKDKWGYWFYNDGTTQGKFIIAFSEVEVTSTGESGKMNIHYDIKETYNGEVDIV